MARKPRVLIARGIPGFDSIRQIAERFGASPGSVFMSSRPGALVHVRSVLEANEPFAGRFERSEIEIKSLSELARMFLGFAELTSRPIVSPDGQAALASIAAATIRDDSSLAGAKDLPGFHRAVAETYRELRTHRIAPDALEAFGGRTAEFGRLMPAIEEAIDRAGRTTLTHRLEAISQSPPRAPKGLKALYWTGESNFTPVSLVFAKWLVEAGLRIVFLVDHHPSNQDFYPQERQLRAAFPDAEVETLLATDSPLVHVFGEPAPLSTAEAGRIVSAPDELTESEWALRFALRAGEGNAAVFCRSLDTYGPLLSVAAAKLGTTLRIARPEKLEDAPFARHVLRVLEAAASGTTLDVAGLCFTAYSDIPVGDRERVAALVRSSAGRDDAWGILAGGVDGVPLSIAELAAWRNQAIAAEQTIGDWMLALNRLVARMPWLDVSAQSGTAVRERDAAAQHAMLNSLGVASLPVDKTARWRLDEFVSFVEEAIRGATTVARSNGALPVYSRVEDVAGHPLIVAVGMVEGRFPRGRREDPILPDAIRRQLQPPLSDSIEEAEEERREFHRLCCAGRELILTWPEAIGNSVEVPSVFLDELRRTCNSVTVVLGLEHRIPQAHEAAAYTDRLADAALRGTDDTELATALASLTRARDQANYRELVTEEAGAAISGLPEEIRLSELRALRRCPFQYVSRARLGLRGGSRSRQWRALTDAVKRTDVGTASNADELTALLARSLEAVLREMAGDATREELELIRVSGARVLESFAQREFAARAAWGIRLELQSAELFRLSGFRGALELDGEVVKIGDRVDFVYSRGDEAMPMRLGYAKSSASREVALEELGHLLALRGRPGAVPPGERLAAIDSLQTEIRIAVGVSESRGGKLLRSVSASGLRGMDFSGDEGRDRVSDAAKELKELIRQAREGSIRTTPGDHCERCGYSSLCRAAPNARLFTQAAHEEQTWS